MPSVLRLLAPELLGATKERLRPRPRLQLLVSSGEPLEAGLAQQLAAGLPPGGQLLNLYGGQAGQPCPPLLGAGGCVCMGAKGATGTGRKGRSTTLCRAVKHKGGGSRATCMHLVP